MLLADSGSHRPTCSAQPPCRPTASHYLTESSLQVAEIAFPLGYGNSHSFYRACNQWTGTTPLQHRDAATA